MIIVFIKRITKQSITWSQHSFTSTLVSSIYSSPSSWWSYWSYQHRPWSSAYNYASCRRTTTRSWSKTVPIHLRQRKWQTNPSHQTKSFNALQPQTNNASNLSKEGSRIIKKRAWQNKVPLLHQICDEDWGRVMSLQGRSCEETQQEGFWRTPFITLEEVSMVRF